MFDAIIADDYDDHAELLEYHLKILGVKTVAKARNGMEAFELYKTLNPAFVFLDVSMPTYDGFFALAKIRKQNPAVRLVMVTGDTSEHTKRKMGFLGTSHILYKPVDPRKIREIVEYEWREINNIKSALYVSNL
ncbi:MAG: response regulator [Nitrososphaerota archaeon]|nr:response regulator [Nitrososphaerota archaeon]